VVDQVVTVEQAQQLQFQHHRQLMLVAVEDQQIIE
jgi:hypothetical protein